MRVRAADVVFAVFATVLLALFLAGCGTEAPPPAPPPPGCSCDPSPECKGTVAYVDGVLTCVPPACPEPTSLPADCRGCHQHRARTGSCPGSQR